MCQQQKVDCLLRRPLSQHAAGWLPYLEVDTLHYMNAADQKRIQLIASSAHPELPYHLLSIITLCLNQVNFMFKLGDFFVLHGQKHCFRQLRGAQRAHMGF